MEPFNSQAHTGKTRPDLGAPRLEYTGHGMDGREFVRPEVDVKPSQALLLPELPEMEIIPFSIGLSMFERVMLMVMAITTSVASIIFIVLAIRGYLFLAEMAEALENWGNQLHGI